MSLGEWTECLIAMFREENLTFDQAKRVLEWTIRKLGEELIGKRKPPEE